MQTCRDPHELERVPAFAKDAREEALFWKLNQQLAGLELGDERASAQARALGLVYIVGVPRAGTTLLSQLVSRHLDVGYINQIVARFWRRPAVGIHLSRACLPDHGRSEIDLRSEFGTTKGAGGPHEFGYFWRHWFPLDEARSHHLSDTELAEVDSAGLASALESVLGAFGKPTVFKNVMCGFHAAFLTRIHQRSLFLHITRDAEATARSILRGRRERHGDYGAWWSLKPATFPFPDLGQDPTRDVVRQVLDCRREFQAELKRPGVCSLEIGYEELCLRPAAQLDRIQAALQALGTEVTRLDEPPASLQASRGADLPDELAVALRHALSKAG